MPYQIVFEKSLNGQPVEFASIPVRDVLQQFGVTVFGSGIYAELPGGQSVDFFTSGLNDPSTLGFIIEFRSISAELCELIYRLSLAGDLVAVCVDDPSLPLVTSADAGQHSRQNDDIASPIICNSAEDVAKALIPGFDSWSDWAYGNK